MKSQIFTMALLAAASGAAQAGPEINVREMAQSEQAYNAAEAVLSRQLRLVTLQAQIAEKQKLVDGGSEQQSAIPVPTPAPVPVVSLDAAALASELPVAAQAPTFPFRLVDLWGGDGGYQAYIQAEGMRRYVRAGDVLPGGWRLLEVNQNGLRVQKGSSIKTVSL